MNAASSDGTARPAPLACDGCRRKHLKCDGASPTCGRCLVDALVCSYTASRRGLGRRRRRRDPAHADSNAARHDRPLPAPSVAGAEADNTTSSNTPVTLALPPGGNNSNHAALTACPPVATSSPSTSAVPASSSNPQMPLPSFVPLPPLTWALNASDRDRLLSLFYVHFFTAHPFLVPKPFYAAQRYPHYLDLVVCFAGQHYATSMPGALGLQQVVSSAMSEVDEQTPCRVQALVLYAIILHVRYQPKEAGSCITRAANIAMHLGMNEPAFARENSAGTSVVEESLRRTWWELYIVDIYFAAIHRRPASHSASAKPLPFLPCAQALYEAGECDQNPLTLRTFEDRVFAPEPQAGYSTVCFRIDAIRIMGRVGAMASQNDASPDNIQALDNALAGWGYNLPFWCRDVIGPSGDVDLLLFEARCFIACATIILHFPRSDMPDTVPSAKDVACANSHTQQLAPSSRHHTVKAIAASKDLANLATVPWPLDRHSPFFVCGLALGCIVQLAAASVHVHRGGLDCLQQHRDRVVLMLGALQRLGEQWILAQNATRCLKAVAETIFSMHGDSASSPRAASFQDSALADSDSMEHNPLWFDLFSMDEIPDGFLDML